MNYKVERWSSGFLRIFSLCCLVIIGIFLAYYVFAGHVWAGIGISPASIDNSRIKPGARIEQVVNVSRSELGTETEVVIELDVPDEMGGWVSFNPGTTLTIPSDSTSVNFKIIVQVPEDAKLKAYVGYVRVKLLAAGGAGVSVVQGVRFDLNLGLTDEDYIELLVRAMSISDIYQGEKIPLMMRVENKGNVQAGPSSAIIRVKDLTQKDIVTLETKDIGKIEPNRTGEVRALFEADLAPGQYYAETKVMYGDTVLREDRLTFTVFAGTRSPVSDVEEQADMTMYYIIAGVSGLVVLVLLLLLILFLRRRKNEEEKSRSVTPPAPAPQAVGGAVLEGFGDPAGILPKNPSPPMNRPPTETGSTTSL